MRYIVIRTECVKIKYLQLKVGAIFLLYYLLHFLILLLILNTKYWLLYVGGTRKTISKHDIDPVSIYHMELVPRTALRCFCEECIITSQDERKDLVNT